MIDRRQFLGSTGALIALTVAAALRERALANIPAPSQATARLNALFDVFMEERLEKNPQQLTTLGLDTGKYAWARSKLNDASLERQHQAKLENASRLKRLQAFPRSSLQGADVANYDTVEFQMDDDRAADPFAVRGPRQDRTW